MFIIRSQRKVCMIGIKINVHKISYPYLSYIFVILISQKVWLVVENTQNFRSSRPWVFFEKVVPKLCSKFTGEYPCRKVVLIKLLCSFIEIALRHGNFIFSSNFSFKFNNGAIRKICETFSTLIKKTPEPRQCCRSSVFIAHFEHIPRIVLVLQLLTLN